MATADQQRPVEPEPAEPAGWPHAEALFRQLVQYGATADAELIDEIYPLYQEGTEQLSVEERMQMLLTLIKLVEAQRLSVHALYPFLFSEPAFQIVSTAALHAAAVYPEATDEDPVVGVRAIMNQVRFKAEIGGEQDELSAVALVIGLLSLGDRRVVDEIGPCWRDFSPDGRAALVNVRCARVYAPVVDWLLDWLEDCERDEFGNVAGAIARLAQQAREEGVFEVSRALPIWSRSEERVIEVLQEWKFGEFAERIRPRLLQIAANESAPRVMFDVLQSWGIDHTRRLLSSVVIQAPTFSERPRDLLPLVARDGALRSGQVEFAPLEDGDFLVRDGLILLNWAIFNPYGPTWSCLGLLPTEDPEVDLVFYRLLNPFKQVSGAVAVLQGEERRSQDALAETLRHFISRNVVGEVEGERLVLMQTLPTLVLAYRADEDFASDAFAALMLSPAFQPEPLDDAIRVLRENFERPWDRATAELRMALQKSSGSRADGPSSLASKDRRMEWYELVHDQRHIFAELINFPGAWHGSIDHAGSPLAHHAYTFWQLDDFLTRFGVTDFRWVADLMAQHEAERTA